jgi:hypothetical protein
MGPKTISEGGRAFFCWSSPTQKTPLPGKRLKSTSLGTNVPFKGAKVWLREKVREGSILETMYFSFPVNHFVLTFLTHCINGSNCFRSMANAIWYKEVIAQLEFQTHF